MYHGMRSWHGLRRVGYQTEMDVNLTRVTVDANFIIHLYRAGSIELPGKLFREGLLEKRVLAEIQRHAPDVEKAITLNWIQGG